MVTFKSINGLHAKPKFNITQKLAQQKRAALRCSFFRKAVDNR
jgi:hypothetical protein